MSLQSHDWDAIRGPGYRPCGGLPRRAAATPRPQGSLRYRCPLTGSFVLVTDAATLAGLARPPAQLRCADCGELHLVSVEAADTAA